LQKCFCWFLTVENIRRRGIQLPAEDFEEFKSHVTASYESHKTLADFLSAFHVFLPLIRGDNEAIEQFAYEFCEDQANEKIAYFEVRYSPQLLADIDPKSSSSLASGEAVVKSVNEGLRRGCHAFGVKGRTILCCLGGHPEWSMGVVDLACKFRHEGVVGIDLAGHEILDPPSQEHINAFKVRHVNQNT
jgi:adenosine deaminase